MPGPSASRDDGTPLQPEKSVAKEIGVRYSDQNLSVSVIGFHTNFKDVIVLDNSNTGTDADNAGKVVSKGLELMTAYSPEDFLPFPGDSTFYLNYTFTNANLDGAATSTDSESAFAGGRDGSNVPYVPDHRLSFGADYEYNDFDFGVNMHSVVCFLRWATRHRSRVRAPPVRIAVLPTIESSPCWLGN